MPESLAIAQGARFLYVLPNFQNPSGRCMSEARRAALVDTARAQGLPLVEDNPYGELWYDAAPGFNQRVVHEVIRDGFLRDHVPTIRARYRVHRDAMRAALEAHMPAGCHWAAPSGGMFFWVELPEGTDATALLHRAVALGMAFVPGAAFFAANPKLNTLRLSFVTVAPPEIERGVVLLAQALAQALSQI